MKNTESALLHEPRETSPHRYQVYRQFRNGSYHRHGSSLDATDEAVTLFLKATPAFDGGGLHLWDHREERVVASAEWNVETTRFGFAVRTRSNNFHDQTLATVARQITEREALKESISSRLHMTV